MVDRLGYFDNSPNDYKKIRESDLQFRKGLIAYSENKYEKAIEYFLAAYKSDNYNIEALYNKAAINYHLNKKEEACKDWKFLHDLGQVRGINFYNQYCR